MLLITLVALQWQAHREVCRGAALMKERLMFSPTVEGLFVRAVGNRLTPAIRNEIRAVGIDLDKPLLAAYPVDQYQRAVTIVANRLYPELPPERAHFEIGKRTVYGLIETVIGKGLGAFAKMVGPRRSLLRVAITSKTSTNFNIVDAQEISPNEIEITSTNYVGRPQLMQGCMVAAAEVAGAKNAACEIVSFDSSAERLVLRVRWDS